MERKEFQCKPEELTVITSYILVSLTNDLLDFNRFGDMFTLEYIELIEAKRLVCVNLVRPSSVKKRLQQATILLGEHTTGLRLVLNNVEGYVKLAGDNLDVQGPADVGFIEIRDNISRGNVEGVLYHAHTMMATFERNKVLLLANGFKPDVLDELTAQVLQIDSLNNQQNSLLSDYSRLAQSNMIIFNDLWRSISTILNTGKAIYRGVNKVRLREYTMTYLIKRVNHEGKTKPKAIDPA